MPTSTSDREVQEQIGTAADAAYDDATGEDPGTLIALLKGIFIQLTIIATNTET